MPSTTAVPQVANWLEENAPKKLELLLRAVVYHPSEPILIADNDRHISVPPPTGSVAPPTVRARSPHTIPSGRSSPALQESGGAPSALDSALPRFALQGAPGFFSALRL